jgi:pimeloyl-ACP methyl ester carboxylesterase
MGIDRMTATAPFQDIFFTARDGLRLHARRYGSADHGSTRPLLCLAGLTRNGRDFHDIAVALANGQHPRTVYTLDTRGRGLSEHDPDWRNYVVPVEMQDVIDFTTMAGLHDCAILGTSRGGLILMILAAVQPTIIGAVILNDIGPVIEREGLARISGYVGRAPLPHSWADAARMIRDLSKRHFPSVPEAQWEDIARQLFNERDGKPSPGYDSKLARSFSVLDGPIPPLWAQFDALKRVPVMVLRGENSDILSQATVDGMNRRHPAFATLTVPGQGHAPLLKDKLSIETVGRFLDATDAGQRVGGLAVA